MEVTDSRVSDGEMNECVKATQLLNEVVCNASGIKETFQALLDELEVKKYQTEKGMSFLELKFHTLLEYLINLTYITLKKVSGKSIAGDSAIERIVELRTVLEKVRPIDQKLRHHVNKLLDTVATGTVKPNDPLRFKANPDNMITKESDSESDDDNEAEDEKPKSNVYVPPKITAMHYDGDETLQQRKQKVLEKVQKRALNSSILYELKKQYDEEPEEIKETADLHKLKENKEMKERVRFEEEYMMRLPVPKKQRHDTKQVDTVSNLSSITRFEDISALEMGVDDVSLKKKVSKKLPAKKGKRKSFRNRRH